MKLIALLAFAGFMFFPPEGGALKLWLFGVSLLCLTCACRLRGR